VLTGATPNCRSCSRRAGARSWNLARLRATEIARINLRKHHIPTGKTRHYFGLPNDPDRVGLPGPTVLRIVKYEDSGDSGFYLFYCGDDGVVLTDTWHETLEGAKARAEFEFNVRPDGWEDAELPVGTGRGDPCRAGCADGGVGRYAGRGWRDCNRCGDDAGARERS